MDSQSHVHTHMHRQQSALLILKVQGVHKVFELFKYFMEDE